MRKVICIFLVLLLMISSAGSLAAQEYPLPEKLMIQIGMNNGLIGKLMIRAEGNHPAALALQPFQGVELQFRGLNKDDQYHFYLYQAGEEEPMRGKTEVFLNGSQYYFRSDMIPNEVYRLPGFEDLADLLMPAQGGNPSLGSAILRWICMDAKTRDQLLQPVVSQLSNELELWVAPYANSSEIHPLDNGSYGLDLTYSIPMADLKREVLHLMEMLTASENGQALLNRVFNPEQKETYANPYLDYYYQEAMDSMVDDYDVQYIQTVSMLGNPVSSVLELPLSEERTHFQTLTIEDQGGLISYTLSGEEQTITLLMGEMPDWSEIDMASFWIITRPGSTSSGMNPGKYHAIRVDIAHSSDVSTDEENRDHLRESWKITTSRDVTRLPAGQSSDDYPDEFQNEFELKLHYFSKNSRSSPTYLEADLRFLMNDFSLAATCSMQTASAWSFEPFSVEDAIDISVLSSNELLLKGAEFLAAAGELFVPAESEDEGEPEHNDITTKDENTSGTDASEVDRTDSGNT